MEPNSLTIQRSSQRQRALADIFESLKKWRVSLLLAYLDIKLRYRRSILGPFWITLSMAITVYTMGYLYGHLLHLDLNTYFPYLAGGILGWALIANTIMEMTDTFGIYEGLLKQIKLPYSIYVERIAMRNLLIFAHNLVVLIPIYILFHKDIRLNFNSLFLLVSLFLFYVNALCYGMMLAMIGARYRDVSQIIKSAVQVIFFITPIMWKIDALPASKKIIILLNPFNAILDILREPLLGHLPSVFNLNYVLILTFLGLLGSLTMFSRYRARIIYWI